MKMRGILMRDTGKERGLLLLRRNDTAVYKKNEMVENLELCIVTRRKFGGQRKEISYLVDAENSEY